MGSIWNSLGAGIQGLQGLFGFGPLAQANQNASTAAQQAQSVQQKAIAGGVNPNSVTLPQSTQQNLAGMYPGQSFTTGNQPGVYIPPVMAPGSTSTVNPAPGSTTQATQSAPQTNNAPQVNTAPNSPVVSGNPGTNPLGIPGGGNNLVNPSNELASNNSPYNVSGPAGLNNIAGQTGPNNTAVPNANGTQDARTAQINALTQNLVAGENATPQETQLANEIAAKEQGLGDTLANNIESSGDEGILTGRNAAANAQYQGQITNLTSLLAGLQGQRNLSLQGGQAALSGAENNVPPTTTLSPAQTLVSPFGNTVAGSGNDFSGGEALGSVAAGENQIPLDQAVSAGQGETQNVTSYLQQNPNLNPTNLTALNGAIQWMNGQTGNPEYQTLANYLTAYATQMAPILAPGGSVTDSSRALQQSLIDGMASGQSITQVMAQLDSEAQATLANRASGGQGGTTVAGGNNVTSVTGGTNPPGGGYTLPGGAGTLVQNAQGKWVVQ